MTTTANYMIKAVVGGETYLFQYEDCGDAWQALEEFWHDDYPEAVVHLEGSGEFPLDVIAIDQGKAIRIYPFTFNACLFDHFFDKGWSASSHEPNQRYTLDQFAKDIERLPKADVNGITDLMDRWAGFCYNHPPYDEVILWMVGGSKQHYLYQHFCQKWLHICTDVCDNDTMGTWMKFYRTLDRKWAERLMQYVYSEWKKQ